MVDKAYRKIYSAEPIKFRVMTCDGWIYAEKHPTHETAMETILHLGGDGWIVETFPGYSKFPIYGDNVKE